MKLVLLLAMLTLTGCLERKITVTSNPPGATVWINDTEVGRTPLSTGFKYYGSYDVRLRRDGYEPLSTSRDAIAPITEYPPFDLFASAAPWTIRKNVEWKFDLVPIDPGLTEPKALIERASAMRAKALAE